MTRARTQHEFAPNLASVAARCGVMVVDLATGDIVHWLRLEGAVRELYDVAVLPGRRTPSLIGFRTDEIRRTLSVGQCEE